jgi:hypothetical protein
MAPMDTPIPTDSIACAIEDDPFFDMVVNDPLLLRAEFDDLVGASWGPTGPADPVTALDPGSRPPRLRAERERRRDGASERRDERGSRHLWTAKRSPPPET